MHEKHHITTKDTKQLVLARDLLMFMLLNDLSELEDGDCEDAELLLNVLFFTFAGTIMPVYAFKRPRKSIKRAIAALDHNKQPLQWLHIHPQD